MAVASGGNRRTVEKALAEIGLRSFFKAVVTAEDVSGAQQRRGDGEPIAEPLMRHAQPGSRRPIRTLRRREG